MSPLGNKGFTALFLAVGVVIVGLVLLASYLFYNSPGGTPMPISSPTSTINKQYRIAILQDAQNLDVAFQGFTEELAKEGFTDKNVTFERTTIGGDSKKAKEIAQTYLSEGNNLIVGIGVISTKAIKEVRGDSTIPFIFFVVSDPIANQIIPSYQNPGNNVTGVDSAQHSLSTVRVSLLKQIAPQISKTLFFYNNPTTAGLEETKKSAQSLSMTLIDKKVSSGEDLDSQLKAIKKGDIDSMIRAADGIVAARNKVLIDYAITNKVPLVGTNSGDAESGALLTYGPSYKSIGAQAAKLAVQILQGYKGVIPVQQAERPELIINKKTATAIGLTIPEELLRKANRVIE